MIPQACTQGPAKKARMFHNVSHDKGSTLAEEKSQGKELNPQAFTQGPAAKRARVSHNVSHEVSHNVSHEVTPKVSHGKESTLRAGIKGCRKKNVAKSVKGEKRDGHTEDGLANVAKSRQVVELQGKSTRQPMKKTKAPQKMPTSKSVSGCYSWLKKYPISCQICDRFTTNSLQGLSLHTTRVHKMLFEDYRQQFQFDQTSEVRHTCKICDMEVTHSYGHLNRHYDTKHNMRLEIYYQDFIQG